MSFHSAPRMSFTVLLLLAAVAAVGLMLGLVALIVNLIQRGRQPDDLP